MTYAIINELTLICENVILWDGVSLWTPPEGTFVVEIENIGIGDEVELVDGEYRIKTL